MNKKNEKRLCWNCEGNVSHHIAQCPYCGVDLTQPPSQGAHSLFKGFGVSPQNKTQQEIPQPPYAQGAKQEMSVTKEEWDAAMHEEKKGSKPDEELAPATKKEMVALLLLLPGVVFFLFGIALIFFSDDGVLTLSWNQNVAYFYFLGAAPLLYLGWRAFRR
jgi:hypothetical protein